MRGSRYLGGQSSVEFLVMFPIICLLCFGIIQFGFIFQARSTLNHAAMLSARAGALANGDRDAMRSGLAAGLAPLLASEASDRGFLAAYAKAKIETAALSNLVKLEVLNPTPESFQDFGQPKLTGGGKEIPNDTLAYRNPNPGSKSKMSIQDANLLHLRVTYCYRLVVPIVDRVIHSVTNAGIFSAPSAKGSGMTDPFGTHENSIAMLDPCFSPIAKGLRIQIASEAIVRMQTPFSESNL